MFNLKALVEKASAERAEAAYLAGIFAADAAERKRQAVFDQRINTFWTLLLDRFGIERTEASASTTLLRVNGPYDDEIPHLVFNDNIDLHPSISFQDDGTEVMEVVRASWYCPLHQEATGSVVVDDLADIQEIISGGCRECAKDE